MELSSMYFCLLVLLYTNLPGPVRATSPNPKFLKSYEIAACNSSVYENNIIDIDCSGVKDEDQLKEIFQNNFQSTPFRRLTIYGNQGLRALREGDLSNSSFEEIWITEGVLTKVGLDALSGSFHTAKNLVFSYNSIHEFPFTQLSFFENLLSVDLRHNSLHGFPPLSSTTLQTLFLAKNPLGNLPVDAFAQTPALIDIQLSEIGVSDVESGTFSSLPDLKTVGLGGNSLTSIKEKTVEFNNTKGLVDLGYNNIRDVADNPFPGLTGWVYIHHNHLTDLRESVWRNLLEIEGYVDPYDNPLRCGCDIAWLVREPALLNRVDNYSTCADGRYLRDLPAANYVDC